MEDQKNEHGVISILLDSDVFVAIAKKDDAHHQTVQRLFSILERKPVVFLASNYVFAEAVTVISRKVGHSGAVDFIKQIRSPDSMVALRWINEQIEQRALDFFLRQTSKLVSFIDCTNMALMEYYGMNAIFSFDAIYKKHGFATIEAIV